MIFVRLWRRWAAFWNERESPESLALLRLTFSVALIANLFEQILEGMILEQYAPPGEGGIFRFVNPSGTPSLWRFRWLQPSVQFAVALVVAQLLAALCLLLGLWARASAIACYVLQTTLGDRMPEFAFGGDTIFRVFLFLLCLAPAGAAWSLDAWRRGRPLESVPCWPRRLFVFQLTVVYVCTGVMKLGSSWTVLDGWSAGYLSLNLPGIARWPGDWAAGALAYPLTQMGTFVTVWFERLFFLVPINLRLRRRVAEGKKLGPVRRLLARWDLRKGFLVTGVLFHIGLTILLDLGLFSMAMLSLYPCLLHPHESRRIMEWCIRRNGAIP